MRIDRNPALEKILIDAMRASFEAEERTGLHMSDILKPRQAYYKDLLPQPLTPDQILYFLAGRGHEEVFARLTGVKLYASNVVRTEVLGLVGGEQRLWTTELGDVVSYRPDFRWDGNPFEFKTRRSNLAQPGEEAMVYDNYLEQLQAYCMADKVSTGRLGVFSLLEGRSNDPLNPTHPELAVYDVTYSPGDLSQMETRMTANAAKLAKAKKLGGVAAGWSLPLCAPWMCGKNRKNVIRAAWCQECKKELAEPWASKHTSTKAGSGHHVSAEVVEWEYTPRCQWYEFSQPNQQPKDGNVGDPLRGAR